MFSGREKLQHSFKVESNEIPGMLVKFDVEINIETPFRDMFGQLSILKSCTLVSTPLQDHRPFHFRA